MTIELYNIDCMEYMATQPDNAFDLAIVDKGCHHKYNVLMGEISDMAAGKAGEYLVCADLIMRGFVAYPSEQGLPYDVVLDAGGVLLKIQVKATRTHKKTPQRVSNINTYAFNIKRHGKLNRKFRTDDSCDLFALVALDEKQIGYMKNEDIKQTMFFRVESMRGTYRDENIETPVRGRYLSDMTLDSILCQT